MKDQSIVEWFIPQTKQTETEEIRIVLRGNKSLIERMKRFLSVVAYFGGIGHSGMIAVDVDGDGSDRLKIEGFDTKPYQNVDDAALSGDAKVHDNNTTSLYLKS